jgi:hypothetical protein
MLERSPGLKTLEDEVTTKITGVPYYSQSLDVTDKEGNIDKFWFRRACGITCAKAVLDYFGVGNKQSVVDLAEEGRDKGGYTQSGWRHDYLVQLFSERGLNSWRKENMDYNEGVKEMAQHIDNGGLVVASCIVPFMNEKDFHMILLKGVRWADGRRETPLGFYYSDPDSMYPESASERYVGTETFDDYWRRMAIFVSKENGSTKNSQE